MKDAYYRRPRRCEKLLVGIDPHVSKKDMLHMSDTCALPVCFSVEHLHAWWAGFAEAVGRDDAEELSEWRRCALSTIVDIHHMTNDDITWQSMQCRENVQTDFEALRCTPLMRMLHFGAFKDRLERASGKGKISAPELLKQYKSHLELSARSEKLTPGWVDNACTILNRMYAIPRVAQLLHAADELPAGTNPLDGDSQAPNYHWEGEDSQQHPLCGGDHHGSTQGRDLFNPIRPCLRFRARSLDQVGKASSTSCCSRRRWPPTS